MRGWPLWRVLPMTGLAVLFATFDGSVLTLALPAIAADFGASVRQLSNLGALLALGSLGALPLAALADRTGRRRLIALGVLGFGLANLASAATPSLSWLTAARLVAVCFESLVLAVGTALVVEETPAGHRGEAVALITVLAGAGTFLTVVLYPLLAPHWRLLYLAGGAAVPVSALVWRFLPEGSRWAATRTEAWSAGVLAASPWRGRLMIIGLATAMGAVLFQPANFFTAFFGSSQLGLRPATISAVVFASGAISVPAFLLGGRFSDRLGRRRPAVVLTALTVLGVDLAFGGSLLLYWAGNALWSVLASAAVPALGAWLGELFPTRARATSEAVVAVSGAAGGAAGLLLYGVLAPSLGLGASVMVLSAAALVGAGLLLRLPETAGEPLPD